MKLFIGFLLSLLLFHGQLVRAQSSVKAPTPVSIEDGWVRATHAGQSVGAAYMTLTSPQDSTLMQVESTMAGAIEIHSMTMTNGVMKMRMLKELILQANKPEKLAPGGFHLMLFDLKAPLKAGDDLMLKLRFKDNNNVMTQQTISLPIKADH